MIRTIVAATVLALLACLAGCETLQREPNQLLQIEALDAHDRPVRGLVCRVGDSPTPVALPANAVVVRRSYASLEIDCRRGADAARATVLPRRDGVEQALVPFGSLAVLVDHLSGKSYEYPTVLRLRLGQHVTLEHGSESRIVKSEPLPAVAVVAKTKSAARAAPKTAPQVVAVAEPARQAAPATW